MSIFCRASRSSQSLFFALAGAVHALYQPDPSAIQNISEGDLNTAIEVQGDDEFTAMAVNLNKMVGDIRNLMDKGREAERTKNELITNVARSADTADLDHRLS